MFFTHIKCSRVSGLTTCDYTCLNRKKHLMEGKENFPSCQSYWWGSEKSSGGGFRCFLSSLPPFILSFPPFLPLYVIYPWQFYFYVVYYSPSSYTLFISTRGCGCLLGCNWTDAFGASPISISASRENFLNAQFAQLKYCNILNHVTHQSTSSLRTHRHNRHTDL